MPLLRRSAGTTEVTDIGIAFAQAQAAATGSDDTSLPAVYRSHQLITDLPASLSLEQISGTGVADPITPPLLTQPNPTETYPTTMRKIMSSLVMRGNTYLWPTGRDLAGNIRSVYVLDPDEVTVAWDSQRLYPRYQWRGTPMVAGRDIFHISINHLPGRLRGLGPIEATRVMLNGAKAEQNMARRIFEDDATPGGLLKVPRSLSPQGFPPVVGRETLPLVAFVNAGRNASMEPARCRAGNSITLDAMQTRPCRPSLRRVWQPPSFSNAIWLSKCQIIQLEPRWRGVWGIWSQPDPSEHHWPLRLLGLVTSEHQNSIRIPTTHLTQIKDEN